MRDALERDLFIAASELRKAAFSLTKVCQQLRKERERASVSAMEVHSPPEAGPEPIELSQWPAESALPFPEDPFE